MATLTILHSGVTERTRMKDVGAARSICLQIFVNRYDRTVRERKATRIRDYYVYDRINDTRKTHREDSESSPKRVIRLRQRLIRFVPMLCARLLTAADINYFLSNGITDKVLGASRDENSALASVDSNEILGMFCDKNYNTGI